MTIYQIDAFTDRPFSGNPAAVCLLPYPIENALMQAIAAEMNLSETAFLLQQSDDFELRWFTPALEVDLCGHATLASAHMLWETGVLPPDTLARFHTRSGLLSARRLSEGIELNFPAQPAERVSPPQDLVEALGFIPVDTGHNGSDYLVVAETEDQVKTLNPDFAMLREIDMRGVIVTARSSDSFIDFISRFFAPGAGIDEDPVTGSAHCCLGPYWATRLKKTELVGFQASARGGFVSVRLADDRVHLTGKAVTVMEGQLRLPSSALD
jgi:PhzF family phenazine biosynthesis protein